MTSQITEYRASHIDVRKVPGDAVLMAQTDKGQVVLHITEPAFQQLARRTTLAQSGAQEPSAPRSDKDMEQVQSGKWYLTVECRNQECQRGIAIGEPTDDPTEPQALPDILGVVCPHCGHSDNYPAGELRFVQAQYRQ